MHHPNEPSSPPPGHGSLPPSGDKPVQAKPPIAAEPLRSEKLETELVEQIRALSRELTPGLPGEEPRPRDERAGERASVNAQLAVARHEVEAGRRAMAAVDAALDAIGREWRERGARRAEDADLHEQRRQLDERLRRLDRERAELDREWTRTGRQRRRIAAALRLRRDELRKESTAQRESAARDLVLNRDPSAPGDPSAPSDAPLSAAATESAELISLRSERNRLLEQLTAAEAVERDHVGCAGHADELQRRFELAVRDLQSYKLRVNELESALEKQLSEPVSPPPAGGPLDWEAQKTQLIADLDADNAQEQSLSKDDRMTLKGTVRITDEIVAAKDREIAELHRRIKAMAAQVSKAASPADALAEVLDVDAVISEERQRLHALQKELREQQRQASVELAVERAKIARDRAELEEKARSLAAEGSRQTDPARRDQPDPAKPVRGRWLSKLGLKDLDEES